MMIQGDAVCVFARAEWPTVDCESRPRSLIASAQQRIQCILEFTQALLRCSAACAPDRRRDLTPIVLSLVENHACVVITGQLPLSVCGLTKDVGVDMLMAMIQQTGVALMQWLHALLQHTPVSSLEWQWLDDGLTCLVYLCEDMFDQRSPAVTALQAVYNDTMIACINAVLDIVVQLSAHNLLRFDEAVVDEVKRVRRSCIGTVLAIFWWLLTCALLVGMSCFVAMCSHRCVPVGRDTLARLPSLHHLHPGQDHSSIRHICLYPHCGSSFHVVARCS